MSIKSEAERIQANIAAAYTAASAKGATMPAEQNSDNLAEAVESIPAGGTSAPVEEKDVNFWDYDGTLLYSYTLAEAQALTELPKLPEREGLICQGWNWTLEQIKSFGLQVDVGAVYITDDGKTRIKIDVSTMLISNVTLNIGDAVVNIDWGDGSAIEQSTGTGNKQHTHQYTATGIYTISLEVVSGTLRLGGNETTRPLIGGSANDSTRCAIEVYCGSNISTKIGWLSLQYSRKLRYMTIPEGVTELDAGIINNVNRFTTFIAPKTMIKTATIAGSNALRVLSFPWGITGIAAVNSALATTRFTLPPNVVTLGTYVGYNAQMTVLHLPASLTTIGNNSFNTQYILAEIYAHSDNPPTLGGTAVFSTSADYLKIYVPAGSLEAYQTATNWAAHADKMEEWNP